MLCKHSLAIVKTSVCHQHCVGYKCKIAPQELLCTKLTPSQPDPADIPILTWTEDFEGKSVPFLTVCCLLC